MKQATEQVLCSAEFFCLSVHFYFVVDEAVCLMEDKHVGSISFAAATTVWHAQSSAVSHLLAVSSFALSVVVVVKGKLLS
jgi:hypothetical protein